MGIVSNYQPRPLYNGFEFVAGKLREDLKAEFDHLQTDEEFDGASFFKYHDNWYCIDQFCRVEDTTLLRMGWQGYLGESTWSSLLVGIKDSGQSVIVGRKLIYG